MSHREEHDKPPGDPLNDLESALGALRPVSRLDRDRTLFRAGEAQAATSTPRPKARWGWPALAASLALIAQRGGIGAAECWDLLVKSRVFDAVDSDLFKQLLRRMGDPECSGR